jgi:phi13 family phage major tail protein
MARIGMKYIVCAPYKSVGGGYGNGSVIARAIKANVELNFNDVDLHSDDRKTDTISEFADGKITIEGDSFSFESRELLLGHKSDGETLTYKIDDDGSFVGVGFYSTTRMDGKNKYLAIWHTKAKFKDTGESYETKGSGTNFQTPVLSGSILANDAGLWKEEALFDTEREAREWLDEKANIASVSGD